MANGQISVTSLTNFILRVFMTSCILFNRHRSFGFESFCNDVTASTAIDDDTGDASFNLKSDKEAQASIDMVKDRLTGILEAQRKHTLYQRRAAVDTEDPVSTSCIDVSSGQSVVTQLCDKLSRLERRLAALENDHHHIINDDNSHHEHNSNSNSNENISNNGGGKEKYDHLHEEVHTLQKRFDNLNRPCAFHAIKIDPVGEGLVEDRLTGFNSVVNVGQGLLGDDGVFVAPWDGVYYFTVSFQKGSKDLSLTVSLVIDHVTRVRGQDDEQAFVNFMTSLRKGQQVWSAISTKRSSLGQEVTFTFSGFHVK